MRSLRDFRKRPTAARAERQYPPLTVGPMVGVPVPPSQLARRTQILIGATITVLAFIAVVTEALIFFCGAIPLILELFARASRPVDHRATLRRIAEEEGQPMPERVR
jgi:hypothetical protein